MTDQLVEAIDSDRIRELVRDVFGTGTRLVGSRLLGAGSGNLAYLVTVSNGERQRSYVFRFNRGLRDDVYEREAEQYRMVAEATGVRVPEIVRIDRGRTLAPTSYMVLEYLDGYESTTLCRDDGDVDPVVRQGIRSRVGRFYADLHSVTRPAESDEASIASLLLGLAQFGVAVRSGYLDVDLDRVATCERAVRDDAGIRTNILSLCLSDGELYFVRDKAGSYELGFVLDLEWVGFDNPLLDISGQAVPGTHLIDLTEPARVSPDELRRDPFFLAYESSAPADFDALCRLVVYRQLSIWGMVAGEPAEPEKKAWIRDAKLPLINRLLDQVSQNANPA